MTTAAVRLPIFDETTDTDILPSQETDTKWVIRGKIFETDFQQTPVSGVEVQIWGKDLKLPLDALSNANGEYEFVLLPGHYFILLYKNGYEDIMSLSEATAENKQSSVIVIEEGMFVVYEAVAKGNVLALKHGMSKEQRSFSERYGETIRTVLLAAIIGGISGFFFVRFLNKRQQKYSQE